jgi:hypothetical protein
LKKGPHPPGQLIQLRQRPCTAGFQLPCQFHKIFRSNSADQPDGRAAPVDSLFYLQGHATWAKRNERATRNYCKDRKLKMGMMLIFRQMPNCQQHARSAAEFCFAVRAVFTALDNSLFSFTVPARADVMTAAKNPMAAKGTPQN